MRDLPSPGDAVAVAGHPYRILTVDPFPDGMRLTLERDTADNGGGHYEGDGCGHEHVDVSTLETPPDEPRLIPGRPIVEPPAVCDAPHPDLPYTDCVREPGHPGLHVGDRAGLPVTWQPKERHHDG